MELSNTVEILVLRIPASTGVANTLNAVYKKVRRRKKNSSNTCMYDDSTGKSIIIIRLFFFLFFGVFDFFLLLLLYTSLLLSLLLFFSFSSSSSSFVVVVLSLHHLSLIPLRQVPDRMPSAMVFFPWYFLILTHENGKPRAKSTIIHIKQYVAS